MRLIQTTALTGSQSSIVLSSIPQNFTDLVVLISARLASGGSGDLIVDFNGVTTDLSSIRMGGSGATGGSGSSSSSATAIVDQNSNVGATVFANTFGSATIYIPNYSGNSSKTVSIDSNGENNGTSASQNLVAGRWADTSAITSIRLTAEAGVSFAASTTVSLYAV